VGFVGAGRAAARAERFGKRVGAQGADDEASGRGLGDADTDGPPVVSDVRGLLLDFAPTGTRRGGNQAFPPVVDQAPAPGARVVDLANSLGVLNAEQKREDPAHAREQDEDEDAGLGGRAVPRC
jgi:hypothetical protein